MKTINRLSPLQLRGKSLRNRIVVPPMASQTADLRGFVTNETLSHYERLSEAQPGLLIVEYTCVHPSGRSEDNQLGIQSDLHIPGLSKLAALIKRTGALAGLQITHSGGKSDRELTSGMLMGPSGIAVPVKDRQMEAPRPMTTEDIALWKAAFVMAADRAVLAGFDLVEFHSAHGYGLNQWLSPITNQRSDAYGGDLSGRTKLLIEIVSLVRARHPNLLISVRTPGQDFIDGGLKPADTILIAQRVAVTGVDIIHVSSGIGGWRRPSERKGEGYLVQEAAHIQSAVKIPVVGVGGIQTAAYIDEGIRTRKFSLAAVGRAILNDPKQWASENICSVHVPPPQSQEAHK